MQSHDEKQRKDDEHFNNNVFDNSDPNDSQESEALMVAAPPSNQCLLGTAFTTFMGFAIMQMFFAFLANSNAMKGDSAAMIVDSATYFFNWMAERKKQFVCSDTWQEAFDEKYRQSNPSTTTTRLVQIRKRCQRKLELQMEIIPPVLSLVTLVSITTWILCRAVSTMLMDRQPYYAPNLGLMMTFSGINLGLDFLNVFCFAKANHLLGYRTTGHSHHHHNRQQRHRRGKRDSSARTPSPSHHVAVVTNSSTGLMDDIESHSQVIANVDLVMKDRKQETPQQHRAEDRPTSALDVVDTDMQMSSSPILDTNEENGSPTIDIKTFDLTLTGNHDAVNDAVRSIKEVTRRGGCDHSATCGCEASDNDSCSHRDKSADDESKANMNMCSAYTHVFADTLRSIAVLVAAALGTLVPSTSPQVADASASIVISALICLSLIPLCQGLWTNGIELRSICAEERTEKRMRKLAVPSDVPEDDEELTQAHPSSMPSPA